MDTTTTPTAAPRFIRDGNLFFVMPDPKKKKKTLHRVFKWLLTLVILGVVALLVWIYLVPMITANTVWAPAAAPSMASETARQLASLARRTSRFRRALKSLSNG